MSANASVHNSCAPEVSPQPNCETIAIFLWPANRPFVGGLFPLGAQPVPLLLAGSDGCQLLLGCRRGLLFGIPPREQPVLGLGLLLLLLGSGCLELWDRGRGGG